MVGYQNKGKVINIDHQLQRTFDMRLVIESTKTNAGTRKLPMTEDVAQCFRAIIEDREESKYERVVDGYAGFLFTDKNGYPEVAMHWEHRFNHMVKQYNDIYRVQMPNITPPHLPPYLLQQHGEVRHEPLDAPIPDGA